MQHLSKSPNPCNMQMIAAAAGQPEALEMLLRCHARANLKDKVRRNFEDVEGNCDV